ncbi:MAG: hypothetical protein KDI88_09930 [Gammaproteobacteria bacterium]|nr:hypothetical protein [Gammaproteobacteria bacterium]
MSPRYGKLLLIVLVPALLYGAVKGIMYYNARNAIDRLVDAAAGQAEITYAGIETEVLKAVAVNGISVKPSGVDAEITIDRVRLSSDDPMFFIFSSDWKPGEGAPPSSLGFELSGLSVPVDVALMNAQMAMSGTAVEPAGQPCENGLQIEPPLLRAMGFERMSIDADGNYRIDSTQKTLDVGMFVDVRDVQSLRFDATLNDVDPEVLEQGGAPDLKLARMEMAVRVSPEFGRQALKACAIGTELTLDQWSERLAEQAIGNFELAGLSLGPGLSGAVRSFYRDWGQLEIIAAPSEPIGMLSMMFLPPDQLIDAMSLRFRLNDQLITDTSFTLTRPDANALAALLGQQQPQVEQEQAKPTRPPRIVVRRDYEKIPVGSINRYINHRVRITPRGLPEREGVLKGIDNGIAEVEQTVHGGKYTAYVPVADIASVEALVQREVSRKP